MREELSKEYLYLSAVWDDFDRRILIIKGWTAVGGGAAVFTLANARIASPLVPVALGVLITSLWLLEAQWKVFQYSNLSRIADLERYFRGEILLEAPFQSHHLSSEIRKRDGFRAVVEAMFPHFVCIPYVPLILLIAAMGWRG